MNVLLKIIIFAVVLLFSSDLVTASQIPPQPICYIKAKFVRDLGRQSTLSWKVKSSPKAERPFQCADEARWPDYERPSIEVEVLEIIKVINHHNSSNSCPVIGSKIEVVGKLIGTAAVYLQTHGDECFVYDEISDKPSV